MHTNYETQEFLFFFVDYLKRCIILFGFIKGVLGALSNYVIMPGTFMSLLLLIKYNRTPTYFRRNNSGLSIFYHGCRFPSNLMYVNHVLKSKGFTMTIWKMPDVMIKSKESEVKNCFCKHILNRIVDEPMNTSTLDMVE